MEVRAILADPYFTKDSPEANEFINPESVNQEIFSPQEVSKKYLYKF